MYRSESRLLSPAASATALTPSRVETSALIHSPYLAAVRDIDSTRSDFATRWRASASPIPLLAPMIATTKPNVFEPQSCFCAGFVVGLHVPPPWATRNVCVIPWREFLQVRFVKGTCSNRDGWLVVDRADGAAARTAECSAGVQRRAPS